MRRRAGAALALAAMAALAGCDDVEGLYTEAVDKGESDVPEAARPGLSEEQLERLHQRSRLQNFN